MIVDIFFSIVTAIIRLFCAIMPTWHIPDAMLSILSYFAYYLSFFNQFFPFDSMLIIISMAVSIEIIIISLRFAAGFLSILRGGGKVDI